MATITYLLALLLSNLLGIQLVLCAGLIAGFTGLYATKGGFEPWFGDRGTADVCTHPRRGWLYPSRS